MKNVFLYTLILLYTACNPMSDYRQEYLPPKYKQNYKSEINILNNELVLRQTNDMQIFDNYLVLPAVSVDNSNVFQLLSTNDGHLIKGFAYLGRGTNELSDYQRYNIDNTSKILYALDGSNKLIGFNLDSIIDGNRNYCIISKHFDSPFPAARQVQVLDNKIFQLGGSQNPRIFITNIEGDTLLKYDNIPYISANHKFDSGFSKKFMTHYSHYTIKPDMKKIANVTNNGMMLEILSISNKNIQSERIRYFYEPQMESLRQPLNECVFGATQIQGTNKYIYVLYYDSQMKFVENSTPIMGVFDWDGNEVACYNLNNHVTSFVVTPDDTRIYCWAYNSEGVGYLGFLDLS